MNICSIPCSACPEYSTCQHFLYTSRCRICVHAKEDFMTSVCRDCVGLDLVHKDSKDYFVELEK